MHLMKMFHFFVVWEDHGLLGSLNIQHVEPRVSIMNNKDRIDIHIEPAIRPHIVDAVVARCCDLWIDAQQVWWSMIMSAYV